jgi:hypothetical protein
MTKKLVIFVEGRDDERFFERTFKGQFFERYVEVQFYQYRNTPDFILKKFLYSLVNNMKEECDYIFTGDFDEKACYTSAKKYLQARFSELEPDKIFIVRKEIESWYLAILNPEKIQLRKSIYKKITLLKDTEAWGKEEFRTLIPPGMESGAIFQTQILQAFEPSDLEAGLGKNSSLRYFYDKTLAS